MTLKATGGALSPFVVLRWGFALLGITAVFLILLIVSGQFDPKPIGTAAAQIAPGEQTIPAQGKTSQWLTASQWLPLLTPGAAFTVRGTAVFDGDNAPDVRCGLRLGTPEQALDVLVSPSGYAVVRAGDVELFPYQPWPHVRADQNEIWVDVTESAVSVRINREWLWSGTVTFPLTQIGLVAENFDITQANINWQTLTLYHP